MVNIFEIKEKYKLKAIYFCMIFKCSVVMFWFDEFVGILAV